MPPTSRSTARSSGWPSRSLLGMRAEADEEAAALRRETDEFIDARMASFESVLHKTVEPGADGTRPTGGAQWLGCGRLPMKLDRRTYAE